MLAYYNDPKIKNDILSQLADHASADQIVKGQYWKNGKGCAVGCTIHSGNHMDYEDRFGIPVMLARLEDRIFEGLPNEAAMKWPTRFMSAIEPGADLSLVGWKFQYWLLTDEEVNPGINHPLVKDSIKQCADVLIPLKGQPVDQKAANAMNAERSAARSAASAAWSAAESAESAAESAESAAESAESAARSAESAASAARSAGSAARSAESAAWSTARSAMNAARSAERSAASAACAERSTERAESSYTLMADKILTLLSEAQPPSIKATGDNS